MAKTYAVDIKPLFRPMDINCMSGAGIALDDANFMCDPAGDATYPDHANARLVFSRLTDKGKTMPPDAPWPQFQIDTYETWMSEGFAP